MLIAARGRAARAGRRRISDGGRPGFQAHVEFGTCNAFGMLIEFGPARTATDAR